MLMLPEGDMSKLRFWRLEMALKDVRLGLENVEEKVNTGEASAVMLL